MADGVILDPGAGGATIKTDDDGTFHWQEVKIAFGADNTQTRVTATIGLPSVLLASSAEIGNVKNSGTFATQATLQTSTAEIGNVKNAGTFAVQSTLNAETTKVIGTVNISAAQTVAVTNAGTFATQATLQAGTAEIGKLAAGTAEIGNVANSGTFATQATLQLSTAEIGNVKNSGTFPVQSTLSAETTKVIGTVNVAAAQTIAVTNAGTFATQATLQAGSASIGTLGANSGVDIGDVDVTSIAAGSNLIGDVGISGARTSGGTTMHRNVDVDETEDAVKASAGQIYWIQCTNIDATPIYLHFYNLGTGSVTVGTTTPDLTFLVPSQGDANGAGFVLSIPNGIEFDTAITVAATTTVGGSAGPGLNEVLLNLGIA